MKEYLWRLYGGLYTFVSTTRCLSRPLYLNRADDNIFRIIVYCRPKRQTIQLSRKPFFGRNVVTLRKEFSDVSLTVPLFQKLVQRGMENIQLGCFALWIRYFPYIVSIKVMPYLNPIFRIISDKIFFGTLEYLRWVPNDFLQPKVRSLFAFIRNTGGKIVTFSEDVNKTPKVSVS